MWLRSGFFTPSEKPLEPGRRVNGSESLRCCFPIKTQVYRHCSQEGNREKKFPEGCRREFPALRPHPEVALKTLIQPQLVVKAVLVLDSKQVLPCSKPCSPTWRTAYVPEVEIKAAAFDKETVQDDGLSLDSQDAEYLCNEEKEDGVKAPLSPQDSPFSSATNLDAGYASPFSDASDRMADYKSTSSKEEKEEVPRHMPSGNGLQDSLVQMKAVYANLISDAAWSSFTKDITKSQPVSSSNAPTRTASPTPTNTSDITRENCHHDQKSSSASSLNETNGTSSNVGTATPVCSTGANNNGSTNNGGSVAYDWHQAALAKTLQQNSYHLLPEPSLFSTVQLYRQNNKLYGSVFTGASKFRCKDCSAAYDTLVGLTIHMNETGHYRDDNKDKEEDRGKRWSKPRKRSLMEMEGKEDAQKVLKCMYCGHSFESLQDLSVHMIKTKHYQKVPLKEPVPVLATNLLPSAKKRSLQDPSVLSPCSPDSLIISHGPASAAEAGKDAKGNANPYVTPNNRYGYQNGASYMWQFEARKSQILKCMECGSSHDTLQQLTAHMMITGHFLKVTNTASKKSKQLVFDPVMEEKIQSIPLPPTTIKLPLPSLRSQSVSPALSENKKETEETKMEVGEVIEKKIKEEEEELPENADTESYKYIREEDLEVTPKEGMDILKSLENTVSSAITKAQTGTPTWGGYPSIHAAYQLQGSAKPSLLSPSVQSVPVQPVFNSALRTLVSDPGAVIHPPHSPSSPLSLSNNVSAMEKLVEKVMGKVSVKKEKEELMVGAEQPWPVYTPSSHTRPAHLEIVKAGEAIRSNSPRRTGGDSACKLEPNESVENQNHTNESPVSNGSGLGIITDHLPDRPFLSPLSALQSVMNAHLSKVSKPVNLSSDPLSMLYKFSSKLLDKPASQNKPNTYRYEENDEPMDLRKSKSRSPDVTSSDTSTISQPEQANTITRAKPLHPALSFLEPVPSLQENALMDISDMVKNLTEHQTPKSSTPSSISEKSDADSNMFEDTMEDLSSLQKRKGRQSNWNPQHLLILQAQFASSLRETPEGRYAMTDLGPQERVHICKFTGLSMTTISHWLANVKYQLRRTGGTKFLKNMDSCQPVFLCGDCASQFRTPSSYIRHLESHLGFSLKDLSRFSVQHLQEQQAVSKCHKDKMPNGSHLLNLTSLEEDSSPGLIYQCRLCSRTFVSKHAIKLHLSKTHGKSPEDHLVFVTTMEKLGKEEPIVHQPKLSSLRAASCGAASCGAASRGAASRGAASCGAASCGAASCGAASCGAASREAASCGQHPVGQCPVGRHPVSTDEGLEDDQHCTVQQQMSYHHSVLGWVNTPHPPSHSAQDVPKVLFSPPLLYTLYTHDCTTTHSSNTIIEFADGTTIIGNITNDDEGPYGEEVQLLTEWCTTNNLSLSVSKTKELISTSHLVRKAEHRLHFLHPSHPPFQPQPSGKKYRSIRARTTSHNTTISFIEYCWSVCGNLWSSYFDTGLHFGDSYFEGKPWLGNRGKSKKGSSHFEWGVKFGEERPAVLDLKLGSHTGGLFHGHRGSLGEEVQCPVSAQSVPSQCPVSAQSVPSRCPVSAQREQDITAPPQGHKHWGERERQREMEHNCYVGTDIRYL
ncbi:hypothetical protein NFI96_001582 [Prochilodus magdalenae]|nr:hypothetical protein NFI96_001582 [Prochilodus magdalenae]